MTCSDLKTIMEYNLPVKIAIMNNDAQMMVTIWERLFFNERYAATINNANPSYTKLAESFGMDAILCDNYDNLEKSVDKFINHSGPILCEFRIERDICLPLVGPGKALDDMIINKKDLEDKEKEKKIKKKMEVMTITMKSLYLHHSNNHSNKYGHNY